eukprot:CAMPEP_0113847754 /NCGR_PEP_ID=MMETSP0372-20130328/2059_1 /TAXON_ID=340204 /ORGANISM="Lankesteria abbotti" /LENGTH=183 /DNA_ID=CAMNT_0000817085 /DNA_START=53 /DNA_END=601 /DNA_ORIENTATION=+ /assembly_acc=CAM_ASM_000359
MVKPVVVFCLGGPGSGKSTNCKKAEKEFGFKHISAGDCLREEQALPESDHGRLIEKCIRDGSIVPVEITCALLKKKMEFYGWESGKFLIDGFPRNQDNLDGWMKFMGDTVDLPYLLFYDCSEDEMVRRLTHRGQHSGRIDDNVESIKKRFRTYNNDTMPIVQIFEKDGKCRRVDATKDLDTVW